MLNYATQFELKTSRKLLWTRVATIFQQKKHELDLFKFCVEEMVIWKFEIQNCGNTCWMSCVLTINSNIEQFIVMCIKNGLTVSRSLLIKYCVFVFIKWSQNVVLFNQKLFQLEILLYQSRKNPLQIKRRKILFKLQI